MTTKKETAPSRDLTFEWGRTASADLAKIGDTIDSRAIGIFATGSLIIGVSATVVETILDWSSLALLFVVAGYLATAVFGLLIVFPHPAPGPDNPTTLRKRYWPMPPAEAQEEYWQWVEDEYEQWYPKVNKKGRYLRYAIGGLGVEVSALIVWVILVTGF